MAHRSGLIREPPVGNYFDPTEPTLEKTVASLNGIGLDLPAGARIKYSNAAIGVVGYALEKSQNEKFEKYVQRRVLDPLGHEVEFVPADAGGEEGPRGRGDVDVPRPRVPGPDVRTGHGPGRVHVLDRARPREVPVVPVRRRQGRRQAVPQAGDARRRCSRPQFAEGREERASASASRVGELDGKKRVGHGGAVYGFATEFVALPDEKLGVSWSSSRDVANAVTARIAERRPRLMLAAKAGKPLPTIETSEPLAAGGGPRTRRPLQCRRPVASTSTESFGKLYLLAGPRRRPRPAAQVGQRT